MKSIRKHFEKIVSVGAYAATVYLTSLGLNYLFINNREHIDGAYHSVTKLDGAWEHTVYSYDKSGNHQCNKVCQRKFLKSKTLFDSSLYGEYDGLVDTILFDKIIAGPNMLYRDKDYDQHKEEFDEADRLLAETKERFKEYFE